jgi:hypothetical protein
MIKLTDVLNEIGEGVKPFPFKLWGTYDVKYWQDYLREYNPNVDGLEDPQDRAWATYRIDKNIGYEFDSEREHYYARIEGKGTAEVDPAKAGHRWNITARVDFGTKERGDDATNLGEQFAVMSTIVAITEKFIKDLEADKDYQVTRLEFYPKREKGDDTGPLGTKRGKLYMAYIQKQLSRLQGHWNVSDGFDAIVLKRTS